MLIVLLAEHLNPGEHVRATHRIREHPVMSAERLVEGGGSHSRLDEGSSISIRQRASAIWTMSELTFSRMSTSSSMSSLKISLPPVETKVSQRCFKQVQ